MRGCTDCACCVIFIAALVAFAALYVKVLAQGDIAKLYHGIDTNGKVCGVDAGVEEAPYLYWCMEEHFTKTPQISLKHPVCATHCPGSDPAAATRATANSMYEIQPDCAKVLGAESMASYKTIVVFDRYCLPDPGIFPGLAEEVAEGTLQRREVYIAQGLASIHSAWPVLLGSFFVGVMLGYFYLVLLRHCAEPLIWLTMLLCIVGFAVLGIYLYANAGMLGASLGYGQILPEEATRNEEQATRVAAVICWVISFLLVCLACCFYQSIAVGAACVEVSCDTIFEMPSLLLLPVLKAIAKGSVLLILLTGFLQLFSTSSPIASSNGHPPHFMHSNEQQLEIIFYLLMSFWILCFMNALYQFVVAYAVQEYYYTPYDHDQEKDVGCCSVWDGLFYGLLHHGGSLAFGSLIIAIFMVVQKIIERAEESSSEAGGNKVLDCILYCCHCWVSCCEEAVKHINKNAYIDIAITSDDFCTAARNALKMIVDLGGAMAILNGATFVFTIFGVLLITLGCAAFTNLMVSQGTFRDHTSEFDVATPMAPTVVGGLIGLLVALSFMHVFDMTSDTLLYCYGKDLDSGKGGGTAPAALKELFHTSHDTH